MNQYDQMSKDIFEFEENFYNEDFINLEEEDHYISIGNDYDLKFIGLGAYRAVYEIDNSKIIKFIRKPTTKDNIQEYKRWQQSNNSRFLPMHFEHAKDYSWIIVERLKMLTPGQFIQEFNKQFGFNFKAPSELIRAFIQFNKTNILPNNSEPTIAFKSFLDLINKLGIPMEDFNSENFGIRESTGELVILDFAIENIGSNKIIESIIYESSYIPSKLILNKLGDLIVYKANFDIAEEYAEKFGLKKYGSGIFKLVFSIQGDDNKLLKVATDNGTNSLKQEVNNYLCAPELFPRIYDYDNKLYKWIIVEKIENIYKNNPNIYEDVLNYFNITKQDIRKLNKLIGYKFINTYEQIFQLLKYYNKDHYENQEVWGESVYKLLFSNPKLKEFLKQVSKCKISLSDLHANNIGFRDDGSFVIIDSEPSEEYGFQLESLIFNE